MYPKNIMPRNKVGNLHGYIEKYWSNGQLCWKGVYVNGKSYGYQVEYNRDGSVNKYWTGYFFDDEKISEDNKQGYCYIWDKEII